MIKKEKDTIKRSLEEFADEVKINPEITKEQQKLKGYYTFVEPNLKLILTMLNEGYTQEAIHTFLGVSETSWYKYQREIPEFKKLVLMGRMQLLSEIENSAYQMALGEVHTKTVKTKEKYNSETGKFEPTDRETQIKQEKPSERMAEYILKRFSPQWANAGQEQDNESHKVVESIGKLVDTLTAPLEEAATLEETNSEDQEGQINKESSGSLQEDNEE